MDSDFDEVVPARRRASRHRGSIGRLGPAAVPLLLRRMHNSLRHNSTYECASRGSFAVSPTAGNAQLVAGATYRAGAVRRRGRDASVRGVWRL